jgi:hypothetical protein
VRSGNVSHALLCIVIEITVIARARDNARQEETRTVRGRHGSSRKALLLGEMTSEVSSGSISFSISPLLRKN